MRNSSNSKCGIRVSDRLATCLWATLVAVVVAGCGESPSAVRTQSSPVIPFNSLFQLEDTIRLDPGILVGNTGFMDVDEHGTLLITDDVARTVHKFSSAGEYVRRYDVAECLSDDAGIFPLVARTLRKQRVLIVLASKSTAIFTADGKCLAGKRALAPYAKSYCVLGDSIVTHNLYTGDRPEASVFTSALKALPGIPNDPPQFVVLDYTYAGQLGRTMECFRDGPYYIYNESMDAIPVHRTDSVTRYRSAFFTERREDLSPGPIS